MFDLWGDEDDLSEITSQGVPQEAVPEKSPPLSGHLPPGKTVQVTVTGEEVTVISSKPLEEKEEYKLFLNPTLLEHQEGLHAFSMELRPLNCFVLRYFLKHEQVAMEEEAAHKLAQEAEKVPKPQATLASGTNKSLHVQLSLPGLEPYRAIARMVNAYPTANGKYWNMTMARIMDLVTLVESMPTNLPRVRLAPEVAKLTTEPIPGFDGTLNSLKHISPGVLNVIKANGQSYKARKASSKTLEEKFADFGIASLYDLMVNLPRRYIDKSQPQQLQDMVIDEPTTIVGTIVAVSDLPRSMGVRFTVELSPLTTLDVAFWRQDWLRTKFKVGMEVVITGKFGFFNRKPQLQGSSIEEAREAAVVPIVPIYKQSESKGITTNLLFAAERELYARLPGIELPAYLQQEGRLTYYDAYRELHIPTTLSHRKEVLNGLAYLELLDMQLIIQEAKQEENGRRGLPQKVKAGGLQEQALAALPFPLTEASGEERKGQKEAIAYMQEKLASEMPSQTLLNADVGAGKTLIAQLLALQAVDNGYQVVMMAPTDVLGRQLYESFQKLVAPLKVPVESCYLTGSLKAAEKKKLIASIASGECQVIIGTQSAFSDKVKYKNLGMVIIDEQQKFGAEQRSKLLLSRDDAAVPHLLMMTATPIPRSTAQVFYGDMDMVVITEKPQGRLPIITEWLPEDPNDLLNQFTHPLWNDIKQEAAKGNQTFIITPLVKDADKVDAASVERTYQALKDYIFTGLKVGFVHGQMKNDAQKEAMEHFRAKAFDVMVASTVVEVGVDIPDATRVVILSADRMGASSLHQIRGRVGRNSKQSYCYLVSLGSTLSAETRLGSLVAYDDGFSIAQADLALRGEGQLFNSDQSGASEMLYANLATHGAWVEDAKKEALAILASPAREEALADAKARLNMEGRFA